MNELLKQAQNAEKTGNLNKAVELYLESIKEEPDNFMSYNSCAVVFYKLARYKDSATFFEEAIKRKPDYAEAYSNLGAIHSKFKNYKRAIALYQKAIELKPSYAGAYTNIGNALNKSYEYEQAVYFHLKAINLDPNSANHYANCGSAYKNLGRYNRAKVMYKKAIELEPNHVNAHFDLSTVLLQTDEFEAGWKEYEWRFRKEEMQGHISTYQEIFSAPRYVDQELKGKTILIHSEQGFGDSLMVIRYAKVLSLRGAEVVVNVRTGLERLFESVDGIDKVITRGDENGAFDYQVAMMSLPLVCDSALERVRKLYPYLKAPSQKILLPKRTKKSKYRVGLVWGASNTGDSYAKKVLALKGFLPLLELENIEFYSLQVGEDTKEISALDVSNKITDCSSLINDFADTAKIIQELDLVISADTSVAHLAGGMGAKVWVLLQKVPDWRWGVDSNDSLWYPSAKVFRQYSDGEWSDVYERVLKSLIKIAV